jgi:hypothetical protein
MRPACNWRSPREGVLYETGGGRRDVRPGFAPGWERLRCGRRCARVRGRRRRQAASGGGKRRAAAAAVPERRRMFLRRPRRLVAGDRFESIHSRGGDFNSSKPPSRRPRAASMMGLRGNGRLVAAANSIRIVLSRGEFNCLRSACPFLRLPTTVRRRLPWRRGTIGRRPAGAARNGARCAAGSRAAGAEGGRSLGARKLAGPRIGTRRSIFT